MKTYLTLMQREWLQHRFGWTLLAVVPLGLTLLLLSVGQNQMSSVELGEVDQVGAGVLASITMLVASLAMFVIAVVTSLILMSGLARRDHQDRSVEFWMSLPTGHSPSLAAPLVMHLLVVPAAALVVGLLGGWLVSLVLVTRLISFEAWAGVPWGLVWSAALAGLARVLAGLPLAFLWVLPLVLATVLCNAYFKRWAVPVLALSLTLLGLALYRLYGHPVVPELLHDILVNALAALVTAQENPPLPVDGNPLSVLAMIPGWAWADWQLAFTALWTPLFAGCLLSAAALFALLVDWRRRGAGAAG